MRAQCAYVNFLNTSVVYSSVILSFWYSDLSGLHELLASTSLIDPQSTAFNVDNAVPRIPMLLQNLGAGIADHWQSNHCCRTRRLLEISGRPCGAKDLVGLVEPSALCSVLGALGTVDLALRSVLGTVGCLCSLCLLQGGRREACRGEVLGE